MSTIILGFSDLIAPLTPDDVLALWSDRKFAYQRGTIANRFTALLDWHTLRKLIEDEVIPLKKLRLTYGRRPVPPLFYSDNGKLHADRFARLFEQGSSMLIVSIQRYVPAILAACLDAQTRGIRITNVSSVVTTGDGGALRTHFDRYDLIVLQLEGRKRWQVYGSPVANLNDRPEPKPPEDAPHFDTVLEQGDVLVLPAGYWHLCDNASDRSLHLALISDPLAADSRITA